MNTWPTKKLGEICELVRGSEPGRESYFDNPGKERIRFIRVGDLSGKMDNPKFVNKISNDLVIINPEEVLISFDGSPGIVSRGWNGTISSGIRVIRNTKSGVLRDFLFYYLQTPPVQQVIKFYTTGVTILHASRAIPHIEIPILPLPIQHQIVEQLDAIRKAQELNDKQIALADELFSSLSNDSFRIDNNYKYVTFANLISFGPQNGIYKTPQDFKENGNGNLIDINALYKGFSLSLDNPRKVTLSDDELNTYCLENDDLLVNRVSKKIGGTGKTAIVAGLTNQSTVFESNMMRIRVIKEKAIPLYINYYLNSVEGRKQMLQHSQIANQASINQEGVKKINIPVPSIKIQHQIVEKLQAAQDYKKKLLEQKQKLKELFNSCLDKAMKGELVS